MREAVLEVGCQLGAGVELLVGLLAEDAKVVGGGAEGDHLVGWGLGEDLFPAFQEVLEGYGAARFRVEAGVWGGHGLSLM